MGHYNRKNCNSSRAQIWWVDILWGTRERVFHIFIWAFSIKSASLRHIRKNQYNDRISSSGIFALSELAPLGKVQYVLIMPLYSLFLCGDICQRDKPLTHIVTI